MVQDVSVSTLRTSDKLRYPKLQHSSSMVILNSPLREDLEIRDKSEGRYHTGIRYKWNSFEPMLHIDDMVLTLATGCCKGLGKSQYEAVNCSTGMEYWNSLDCYKCLIQYRTEARTYLLIQLLC